MSIPNQQVVVVKDYPARKALAAGFSLPILLMLSTVLMIPLLFIGGLGVGAAVLVTVLAEVLVIWGALAYTGQLKNWKQALYLTNFSWKNFFMGAGIGLALLILLQVLATVLAHFTSGVESSETSTSLAELEGIQRWIILLIVTPFIVPFVEEVFFRGYILGFLRDMNGKMSKKKATIVGVVVSTIFFAFAHIQGFSTVTDFFLIGWIAAMAVVHSLLVIKTGSVFTAYGSHMAYNLGTVLLTVIATTAT